jgi:lysozyme
MIDYDRLVEQVKRHEGYRRTPYKCSADVLTVGYGRSLEVGISEAEAALLLDFDLDGCIAKLNRVPEYQDIDDPARREVLINLTFNIGYSGCIKFVKMWAAIGAEDWNEAADQMLDSKWATQVHGRATELAQIMRHGVDYYHKSKD